MSRFIQLHCLTSYPPSNLNRDDLGRPKTAVMGGVNRLRVSSQSLKRAWRTSEVFESALGQWKGTRTKRVGLEALGMLTERGVHEQDAKPWAAAIAEQFGKLKKDSLEIEQLAHVAPEEWERIRRLAATLATEKRAPETDELAILRDRPKAVDIALFGRMLASNPTFNVEAAAQVAHALTVHAATVDDDYFTAVDDLNQYQEDGGAAHIGETGFGAGVFYLYLCVDRDLLVDNLQGDRALANQALAALLEAVAKVSPTGKQNSFASRAYTSYILAEKGGQQPRSLSVAFLKPVVGVDQLAAAVLALETQRDNFNKVYGACADASQAMNAATGAGCLKDITAFVTE
ncbi:type I-E CRISPR-associated protein Cas7/Cse4/CasC [Methylococcus sp. ANG]|uniref:type I-E CRISPR-associated protein Cas7/Cse4/CasC n=1 Tax=Methylococcus sp. ANG TaxID=3231903 RepID=UPI0034598031